MKPAANIEVANNDAKIYVGPRPIFALRSYTIQNITIAFALASSSVRSEQLFCFVHGEGRNKANKNIHQGNLSGCIIPFCYL